MYNKILIIKITTNILVIYYSNCFIILELISSLKFILCNKQINFDIVKCNKII